MEKGVSPSKKIKPDADVRNGTAIGQLLPTEVFVPSKYFRCTFPESLLQNFIITYCRLSPQELINRNQFFYHFQDVYSQHKKYFRPLITDVSGNHFPLITVHVSIRRNKGNFSA